MCKQFRRPSIVEALWLEEDMRVGRAREAALPAAAKARLQRISQAARPTRAAQKFRSGTR
jgi:hypothetical protein